jgi:hypothetical protein
MKNYNNNERSNIEVSNTTRSCEKAVNSVELNELNQKGVYTKLKQVAPTKKEGTSKKQQLTELTEPKRRT